MAIDRESPLPLYYQLKRILLAQIESGALKPGDILPTESHLQSQYAVSRTTVRQSLSELEDEGRIVRQRGRGTFVAKPRISHSPEQYPDLSDYMLHQGLKPGWKVLSAEWVEPNEQIAEDLQVDDNQKVFCLRRLRLADDEPIGFHIAHVSPRFAPLIDELAFEEGGALRYLFERSVLERSIANRTIEAVHANVEDAVLLNAEEGVALLRIRRTVISEEGYPIEHLRAVYLGHRFEYHINNMRAINPINV